MRGTAPSSVDGLATLASDIAADAGYIRRWESDVDDNGDGGDPSKPVALRLACRRAMSTHNIDA